MAPSDNLNANGGSNGSPWNIIRTLDQRKTEISRYAYAVLCLFAIASTIATWAKGGDLAQIIVLVFLVFGLAIAIWAFQMMAKARSKLWKAIGLVAAVVVLVSVLSVFVVIVIYIITGTPQNLDRFFGEVEPPGRVFGASIGLKTTDELIVRWDPYRDPEANIFVSYGLATSEAKLTNHGKFDTDTVSTTIPGLEPQTKYRIRLVAEVRGRLSEPVEIETFTNANLYRIGVMNSYAMLYSGELTSDGIATSDDAEIVFERSSPYNKWVYRGAIRQGKPFGRGELKSRPNKCDLVPPNCSLEFHQDKTITGSCTFFLKLLKIDDYFQKIDCLKYTGAVASAVDPGDMVNSYSVGPYIVELRGRGEIENLGNNDEVQIKGSLEDGLLNGWVRRDYESEGFYNFGQYHKGVKKKGVDINSRHPFGYIATITDKDSGPSVEMIMSTSQIKYGYLDGSVPKEGYSFAFNFAYNRFEATEYQQPGGGRDLWKDSNYRFSSPTYNYDINGWQMSCSQLIISGQTGMECTIRNQPSGIIIEIIKMPSKKPKISIATSGNGVSSPDKMAILVDGVLFEGNKPLHAIEKAAPAALIKMANSKYVKNKNNGITIPLKGLDQVVANMFASIYYCAR